MNFAKMHGAGNDYVYINGFAEHVGDPQTLARRVSDRHKGIGSDGLVLILPSDTAHVRMRMFNSDGSEAQMCGNAIRCVGKYAFEHGLVQETCIQVETLAGIKKLWLTVENTLVPSVTVDMGTPEWRPEHIPVRAQGDTFLRQPLRVQGRQWEMHCVSMGNPHAVLFTKRIASLPLAEMGPHFEHHALFPERTNTEWAEVIDTHTIAMRVWERGAGETLACGTGACAVAAVAARLGLAERSVTMRLRGGTLGIEWKEDNHIYMSGEAVTVFEGRLY